MSKSTSRLYEFSAIGATFRAAWNSEPCEKFAQREIAQNQAKLDAKSITPRQALGYLARLKSMTHIYGDTKCSSIVGTEFAALSKLNLAQR